jgi:hypothetical protein
LVAEKPSMEVEGEIYPCPKLPSVGVRAKLPVIGPLGFDTEKPAPKVGIGSGE